MVSEMRKRSQLLRGTARPSGRRIVALCIIGLLLISATKIYFVWLENRPQPELRFFVVD